MSIFTKDQIDAENISQCILTTETLRSQGVLKPIDAGEYDIPPAKTEKAPVIEGTSRADQVRMRYLKPAQETEAERESRYQQIYYEQSDSFLSNQALAKSINTLAEQNFTNRVMAAACDFKEMADHHQRSVFIRNFGGLIEEELKADPTKPSKRLASFATTYFWDEANLARLVSAVRPETTRSELMEFFTLSLNSEPNKKVIDCLPDAVTGEIVYATKDPENKKIKFDFRTNLPYISLKESDKLEHSIQELSKKNFTNNLLASTTYFRDVINPFNVIRSVKEFGPAIQKELEANPDKPSPTLVTVVTERAFDLKDLKFIKEKVTPQTTKAELTEFLTARENWSTGLRMIDYLNHRTVMEMTHHLPEKDRLDIWFLKPELINGFHAAGSLKNLSAKSQTAILNSIKNPDQRKRVQDEIGNELIGGIHVSIGMMSGGNVDPDSIDISGNFGVVRKRRICSHEDNRRFFPTQEHFRSAY